VHHLLALHPHILLDDLVVLLLDLHRLVKGGHVAVVDDPAQGFSFGMRPGGRAARWYQAQEQY
jgi:hypothetical protein